MTKTQQILALQKKILQLQQDKINIIHEYEKQKKELYETVQKIASK